MRNSSWKRLVLRRAAKVGRPHLNLEQLEAREVPDALAPALCLVSAAGSAVRSVYVESSNPPPGRNAVLTFDPHSAGAVPEFGAFNTGDEEPAVSASIQKVAATLFGRSDVLISGTIPDFDEAELAVLLTGLR